LICLTVVGSLLYAYSHPDRSPPLDDGWIDIDLVTLDLHDDDPDYKLEISAPVVDEPISTAPIP
jgi:hypothetical protein